MVQLDRLKDVLSYDPETGDFHWKIRCGHAKADLDAIAAKIDATTASVQGIIDAADVPPL